MVNYSNGKIYKLIAGDGIYVGATCSSLARRKWRHKSKSKKFPTRRVYAKCIEVGWNLVDIVLLERFNCENKDDLHKRERYWIEKIGNLNMQLPMRTTEDNKEHLKK